MTTFNNITRHIASRKHPAPPQAQQDTALLAERAQLRLRLDRALVGRDEQLRRLRAAALDKERAEMEVWDEDHAGLLARLRELDEMLGEE